MSGIAGLLHLDGAEPSPSILQTDDPDAGPPQAGRKESGSPAPSAWATGGGRPPPARSRGQPLSNEDRSVWITADAAIYGDREILANCGSGGMSFVPKRTPKSSSMPMRNGARVLAKFNGVFAFGLWDDRLRQLWLVRDQLGVKPLFYARLPNAFLFGSEIKALLAHPAVKRNVDVPALAYFLGLDYTPAPRTLFGRSAGSARPLPAGRRLGRSEECDTGTFAFRKGRFPKGRRLSGEFEALLADAVRLRLRGTSSRARF